LNHTSKALSCGPVPLEKGAEKLSCSSAVCPVTPPDPTVTLRIGNVPLAMSLALKELFWTMSGP
jgi:hypothetical protein